MDLMNRKFVNLIALLVIDIIVFLLSISYVQNEVAKQSVIFLLFICTQVFVITIFTVIKYDFLAKIWKVNVLYNKTKPYLSSFDVLGALFVVPAVYFNNRGWWSINRIWNYACDGLFVCGAVSCNISANCY